MKKAIFSLFMLAAAICANATTYALYGAAPEGATDLTAGVTAEAQGSAVLDAATPLTFTGAGLSGSQYCNTNNFIRLSLSEPQPMTLTEDYALHVFIKKAEGAQGDVQLCFCKDNWNNHRAPFLIENSAISSTEYSHIVLRYSDRNTDISWNSYGDANMIGTDVAFSGELFRLCAAAGEQFTISDIYVVGQDEQQNPGPTGPANKRYYFFRTGDLPTSDSITMVDLREGVGSTIQFNNLVKTEEADYIHLAMSGSWYSFNQNLSAAVDMSDVDVATWSLVVKMRTNVADNSFNIRLNNAGECWQNDNLPLEKNGQWETVALPLSSSKKALTFRKSMTGTVLQMHANGSTAEEYIDIEYIYLTDDATIPENLTPTPTSLSGAQSDTRIEKVMQNGRLLIINGAHVYDAQGRLVK